MSRFTRVQYRPTRHSKLAGASRKACGFTIFEVTMAASILLLVIAILQAGIRAVDTARNMTMAGQICQSALELLRLQNWSQISALPAQSVVNVNEAISSGNVTSLDAKLNSVAARFTVTRTITSPKSNMRRITITGTWQGIDGRPHSVSVETRYVKNGLNDYLYISH
jgi:hypothetical protein